MVVSVVLLMTWYCTSPWEEAEVNRSMTAEPTPEDCPTQRRRAPQSALPLQELLEGLIKAEWQVRSGAAICSTILCELQENFFYKHPL